MSRAALGIMAVGLSICACIAPATAQDVESFYRGKTINLYIGSNVGGGYDAYGRLVARYIGKYIPGKPAIVPGNMGGAGGNVVSNYVYNVAPKDGTTIAATSAGSLLDPAIGDKGPLKHDPLKFQYLGSANNEVFTCVVRNDAPVKTFADVFKTELLIGSSGGTTHDMPRALMNVLGAKFKLIAGYPGTREVTLAMDKGEVQGLCGFGISSLRAQRPDWFRPGSPVHVLAQETIKGDPELDKEGVPHTLDFAKTEEQKTILSIVYAQGLFTRPFVMAPEVPKARFEAVRKAFAQALADPELNADAVKMGLDATLLSGEDLEQAIRKIYATPPEVLAKVREAIASQ
jgi:tripartite-type tricarboxylate transporter receptor subunit TctC